MLVVSREKSSNQTTKAQINDHLPTADFCKDSPKIKVTVKTEL
ncbi:hypothetical protein T11_17940 [Trichinella zimbabwensis]|uniref:Uncharacterized protein n=1 Tax=Trichinella zimbabwensis TaxID=268475 RepID=A0A0V1GAD7_9BILA|nr:hypothetical protein T11_17940 [Trichinella zimbabwensis]